MPCGTSGGHIGRLMSSCERRRSRRAPRAIARAALRLAASVGKSRAAVLRRSERRRSSSASDDEVGGLPARLREQLSNWIANVLLRLGMFPTGALRA
jgi:hypothetical protein